MKKTEIVNVPVVNWGLLGEENYVTDYVQLGNPALKYIAGKFPDDCEGAIAAVARWVAKHIDYPLDHRGRPTATRSVQVFKWWNGFHLVDREDDYGWLFPNQMVALERPHGICFDTSVLACSLLRIKKVEAYTVLGVVLRTSTKRILGFHAWVEVARSLGERFVMETTVHPKPADLVRARKMYLGGLKVTYDPLAWFDEKKYFEDVEKAKKYEAILNA